jgi:hypothetical protein
MNIKTALTFKTDKQELKKASQLQKDLISDNEETLEERKRL